MPTLKATSSESEFNFVEESSSPELEALKVKDPKTKTVYDPETKSVYQLVKHVDDILVNITTKTAQPAEPANCFRPRDNKLLGKRYYEGRKTPRNSCTLSKSRTTPTIKPDNKSNK